jgi:hypothetical protein
MVVAVEMVVGMVVGMAVFVGMAVVVAYMGKDMLVVYNVSVVGGNMGDSNSMDVDCMNVGSMC